MPQFKNELGKTFGRLTVIERLSNNKHGNALWLCRCKCGGLSRSLGQNLRSGETRSCGCLVSENGKKQLTKHGGCKSKSYNSWQNMRARCYRKLHHSYQDYGGRGITVCDRWNKFENFLSDMGERPSGMSLDRIDVNGHYEPSNCRWLSIHEQNNNRRKVKRIDLWDSKDLISEIKKRGFTVYGVA